MSDHGIDVARLRRLQSAVESAASARHGDSAAAGLVGQYGRLRAEVLDVLPEGLTGEFQRLFPKEVGSGAAGPDIIRRQLADREAQGTLQTMAGWIGGVIEDAS